MRLPFDQSMAKLCESALDRRIVKVVTNLDDQTPDQAGVGQHIQDRGAVDQGCEPVAEGLQLPVVERDGRADADRDPAVATVPDGLGLATDRPQQAEPVMTIEHAEEAKDQAAGPTVEDLEQDAVPLGPRHPRKPAPRRSAGTA